MNINITTKRMGSGCNSFELEPDVQRRVEEVLAEEAATSGSTRCNDAYMQMIKLQRELRWAVERLFPKETEQPYTITLKVEGTADHSPGPRLY